jgi:hypothetical protein
MTQAYDRIIATITTASDASQVVKAMVKSTEWRAGTSGDWNATDCTLTASNVYQFRTPLSGMGSGATTILPNIKASVVVDWDATATAITTVGDYFMYNYANGCTSLTSLSVPDTSGLTTVGDYFMLAFAYNCSSLTSLSVPDTSGLTTVGTSFMRNYANGCTSLTSLSVPDTSGLTTVGTSFMRNYAYGCTSLTSLSVPDTSGLTTVGDYFMLAFAYNCSSLTSLSVPDTSGLTTVGDYFMYNYAYGCTSLTSLLLPSTTGWFASNNVSWNVPSARLGSLKGYAPNSTAQTAWQALTVIGKTLYTNYIQSEDDVEATSQNLTLACNAGSYSLTGTNADFYRALVMACEAGSYALTGSDASLTSHRIFALGMGSYVLVGTSVGLFILSPTPACRTFAIPHENRTATIEHENRTLEVKCH